MTEQPLVPPAEPPETQADARLLVDAVLVIAWAALSCATAWGYFGFSRDYYEYLIYYESLPTTFSLLDTRFEPGFHAVSWIFRNWLQLDMSWLVFALTATSLGIKFLLFRRYLHNVLLSAILYVALFFPIHEYTQYRVGISLALGYWAVHLMLERRLLWAVLLFGLSFSFHYSSILLLIVGGGSMLLRGRAALVIGSVTVVAALFLFQQLRDLISDIFANLNPLSASYLENTAMIEGVSIASVNNLLLIGALICYVIVGYCSRSRYHALFLMMTIASLVPIALLADAPVIAQRSKEVLFVAVVFLVCRSRLSLSDVPGLAFIIAMTGLLGYLWMTGGVIFA